MFGVVSVPIAPGRVSDGVVVELLPLWLSPSFTAGMSPCASVCPFCAAGVCESVVPWLLLCDQAMPHAINAIMDTYAILLFIFLTPGPTPLAFQSPVRLCEFRLLNC